MSSKILSLSISNSFSQDTLEYAHAIAAADGFHLSLPCCRFLNSLVWHTVLFGADVRKNLFVPEIAGYTDLIRQLKELVYSYFCPIIAHN